MVLVGTLRLPDGVITMVRRVLVSPLGTEMARGAVYSQSVSPGSLSFKV
jgi:hypothetical protein